MFLDKQIILMGARDYVQIFKKECRDEDLCRALWEQEKLNTPEFFAPVFKAYKIEELTYIIGVYGDTIKNWCRKTNRTEIPYLAFVKMLGIKKYLILIDEKEPENVF